VATALSDSPPAAPDGPDGTGPGSGAPIPPDGAAVQPAPAAKACPSCHSPMADGQDWCLQCGAGAPGGVGTPSWRSAATILGASAVLVLGAAGAGYAALNKHTAKTPAASTLAATSTPAAASTPAATTPAVSAPATTTPAKVKLPQTIVKPPKIPLTASVPSTKSATKAKTTPSSTTTGGAGPSSESKPKAILLDTNAASTYNPYNYSPGLFGDPSLTIDGDTSTGWTAQVEPTVAPKLAEGVLISLKSKQMLSLVKLVTSTPGMTVQVLGANGQTPPSSITDPAWTTLSAVRLVKKQHIEIKLRHSKKAFTFITLWISKAPAGSTSENPGHVSVNELELFPASQ
jgi:hypothetical protein